MTALSAFWLLICVHCDYINTMKIFVFIVLLFLSFPLAAQDQIEVTADEALEWNRAEQVLTARGNAIVTQGDKQIKAPVITAGYRETAKGRTVINTVTASGSVVLTQGDQTLTAATLTAQFSDGRLGNVTADKDVILTTENETLYGDRAVYDAPNDRITVTGNVKIVQGANILTGDQAVYNLKTNISMITADKKGGGGQSRVRAVFSPSSSKE